MEHLAGIDFGALRRANEMTIRERVVHPLLLDLGYAEDEILRDPPLADPYATLGSGNRRHPLTLVPDYLVRVGGRAVLVLDAKAPAKDVLSHALVQQVYSYASHPEIQAPCYALCNGLELAVWQHGDALATPTLHVQLANLALSWGALVELIGARALRQGAPVSTRPVEEPTVSGGGGLI